MEERQITVYIRSSLSPERIVKQTIPGNRIHTVNDLKSLFNPKIHHKFKFVSFDDIPLSNDTLLSEVDAELQLYIQEEVDFYFRNSNEADGDLFTLTLKTEDAYTITSLLKAFKDFYQTSEVEFATTWPPEENEKSIFDQESRVFNVRFRETPRPRAWIAEEEEKKEFHPLQNLNDEKKEESKGELNNILSPEVEKKKMKYLNFLDKEIKDKIPGDFKRTYHDLINRISENKVTLIVVGKTSAGKTTFINRMISLFTNKNDLILPSLEDQNTGFIWSISKSTTFKFKISFEGKSKEFDISDSIGINAEIQRIDETQQNSAFIADLHNMQNQEIVEITHPEFPKNLKVVDCPGFATQKILEAIKQFINHEIVHLFVLKNLLDEELILDNNFSELFKEIHSLYKKNANIFFVLSKKDKLFKKILKAKTNDEKLGDEARKKIQKVIKIVGINSSIIVKSGLNFRQIYCLDLMKPFQDISSNKLADDVKRLFAGALHYNLKNVIEGIESFFEKDVQSSVKNFLDHHELFMIKLDKIKFDLIRDFQKDLEKFFASLCDQNSQERRDWCREIQNIQVYPTGRKSFMNTIIDNIKARIYVLLKRNTVNLSQKYFALLHSKLSDLFKRDLLVCDCLFINEAFLNRLFENKYYYNRQSFMCNWLKHNYSKRFIFEEKKGARDIFLNWIYNIQNWGLFWTEEGAKKELNEHLTKIFDFQKEHYVKDIILKFEEILQEVCKNFQEISFFYEESNSIKKTLDEIKREITNDFPKEDNLREEQGLALLNWEDIYPDKLRGFEDFFEKEKRNFHKK